MTDATPAQGPSRRTPGPGRGHRTKIGSGIPAGGHGWGGPANGAGSSAPVGPKPENMLGPKAAALGVHVSELITPHMIEAKRLRDLAAAERAAAHVDNIEVIALDPGTPAQTRVTASDKVIAHLIGAPVQRSITATTTLEEMVEQVARLREIPASEAK